VIVAMPVSALAAVQVELAEAVFLPLPETSEGSLAAGALDIVLARATEARALAVGPGLTTHAETAAVVRGLVRESPVPLVLDADGLNAFAGEADALGDRKADLVLTPHLGELARLTGGDALDRLDAARSLARTTSAVALVKGTRTVIAEPGGLARINPTGTPALATAGTGDVLTGVIGALLARGLDPFAAAWAGAYLHGLAGILAASDGGEGVLAGDVADLLPAAVALVERQA
jgi:NAD(P)H-hydrate epimerase